jgi:hypothetical protein
LAIQANKKQMFAMLSRDFSRVAAKLILVRNHLFRENHILRVEAGVDSDYPGTIDPNGPSSRERLT